VQLRPELADGFEKRQVPNVKLACVFHHHLRRWVVTDKAVAPSRDHREAFSQFVSRVRLGCPLPVVIRLRKLSLI